MVGDFPQPWWHHVRRWCSCVSSGCPDVWVMLQPQATRVCPAVVFLHIGFIRVLLFLFNFLFILLFRNSIIIAVPLRLCLGFGVGSYFLHTWLGIMEVVARRDAATLLPAVHHMRSEVMLEWLVGSIYHSSINAGGSQHTTVNHPSFFSSFFKDPITRRTERKCWKVLEQSRNIIQMNERRGSAPTPKLCGWIYAARASWLLECGWIYAARASWQNL